MMYVVNRPLSLGLGQPPAAVTAKCATFLSGLRLLSHFHIHRLPHSTVQANGTVRPQWLTSSAATQMKVDQMNPGFMNSSTGTFKVDVAFNQKLKDLVDNLKASRPPFDQEPFKTFVRSGAKLSIALVDLSSDAKLVSPRLAEHRSTEETKSASLAKIAALYAFHQFKFDLTHEANQNPASMTATRLAAFGKIFDITKTSSVPPVFNFEFNAKFKGALDTLCSNCSASLLIGTLGTTYISSVVRQSGLYDCRLGGLWLGTTYAGPVEIRTKCPEVAKLNSQLNHIREPIGNLSHGATALSAASFFTLLAQGRLVDEPSCLSMKDMLLKQKPDCPSRFEEGLRDARLSIDTDKVFSKIGVLPSRRACAVHQACCDKPASTRDASCTCTCFIHEAALIERVHNGKPLRYAVAVLTTSKPGNGANDFLIKISPHLDQLVLNNP